MAVRKNPIGKQEILTTGSRGRLTTGRTHLDWTDA
jgi:hypothetical protein